jgi:hypothetical protein
MAFILVREHQASSAVTEQQVALKIHLAHPVPILLHTALTMHQDRVSTGHAVLLPLIP